MSEPKDANSVAKLTFGSADSALAASQSSQSNYSSYGVETEAEVPQFREHLRAIRKHIWLVVGIVSIIGLLATIFVAREPDIYTASARVQVDLESNPAAGLGKNGTVVISQTSDPAYFNTQLQNLSGQGMLRRVAKTLDLEHNEAFLRPGSESRLSTWNGLLKMIGFRPHIEESSNPAENNELLLTGSVAPASSRDDLTEAKRLEPFVRSLSRGLRIDPVREARGATRRETRLIDISFTHSDPQVCAKVVNTISDTFVLSNLEKKTETTASTGDFLQRRVAELQNDIRESEEKLVNYGTNHQILSLDGNQNIVVERLSGLNTQLLQAENDRKQAESEYRAIQAPGAAGALASADAKQLDDIQGRLSALRQKRTELLVDNTEEWPEVREVTRQIENLEKQIKDTTGSASGIITTNAETKYKQALEKENALRSAFEKQKSETLTQNQSAINYKLIEQQIDTNKQLLDGLLQRSKENDVAMAGTPNNIFVVDYAVAPDLPTGPQRLRTVVIALFLGLVAALGLAVLLEYLNDTIRSTDDVHRWLRLPSIGVIPSIGAISKGRSLLPGRSALERRHQLGQGELLVDVDDKSVLAESYKHLRTSVLLSTAGRAPKTLLVTSSVPSEGKTTTAVNTAISLAQTGAQVIVIDADMRRPRLHSIFNLENKIGLSSILSKDLNEEEILSVATQNETNGIFVLTSGAIPPNPAELIGSDQMRRLIAVLSNAFTHVVIDSPPVGSFTDGVLAATLVDGVMLVVQSGKTSRNVVRRTKQLLTDVGAKIFGVVLNNVNLREHDYYYYRSYYSHYYGKDSTPEMDQVA